MGLTGSRRAVAQVLVASVVAAGIAVAIAGCGGPAVTPAPSATPIETPDPRLEEIEEGRGVWARRRPPTAAYITVEEWTGMSRTAVRVSELDGRAETQVIELGSYPPEIGAGQAIDALFDRAIAALGRRGDEVTIAFDPVYGYVSRLTQVTPGVADGATSVEVTGFTTPADRTSAARARDALQDLLTRWSAGDSPAWSSTWSRFAAADTAATTTTIRIHHEDGASTIAAPDGGPGDAPPPPEATIQGTVEAAVGTLAAGGWVDVAIAPDGLDTLIAIDPSPSLTGDAFWIRIDHTDLTLERARAALDAARSRWLAADVDAYRYRMTFEGRGTAWTWTVRMDAGVPRVKPGPGAPAAGSAFVAPGMDALFDLVGELVADGARAAANYDRADGHPVTIRIRAGTDRVPEGTITISRFRAP